MKRHFFFKKTNTIIENSEVNTGFSPIATISYGSSISRLLMDIDMDGIKGFEKEHGPETMAGMTYRIKMKNCGSTGSAMPGEEMYVRTLRTSSFDLVLFRLPRMFDAGFGSTGEGECWSNWSGTVSNEGSNWFQSGTQVFWKPNDKTDMGIPGLDNGVYSVAYLKEQYKLFKEGKPSIIIASQHFDLGTEDLDMDITEEMRRISSGDSSYSGFGLSFSPELEETGSENKNCVNFFTGRTNTMYHPFIEVDDHFSMSMDSQNFNPSIDNRSFLFVGHFQGDIEDQDVLPKCFILNKEYDVKKARNGLYWVDIPAGSIALDAGAMFEEEWSDIKIPGKVNTGSAVIRKYIPDNSNGFIFNEKVTETRNVYPLISGINSGETIRPGGDTMVIARFCEEYRADVTVNVDGPEYRIYAKSGENRERDLFGWTKFDSLEHSHIFTLYPQDFTPGNYFLDIRVHTAAGEKMFRNILHFTIASDITGRYL